MATAVLGVFSGSPHYMLQPSFEADVTLCHFASKEMVAQWPSSSPKLVIKTTAVATQPLSPDPSPLRGAEQFCGALSSSASLRGGTWDLGCRGTVSVVGRRSYRLEWVLLNDAVMGTTSSSLTLLLRMNPAPVTEGPVIKC